MNVVVSFFLFLFCLRCIAAQNTGNKVYLKELTIYRTEETDILFLSNSPEVYLSCDDGEDSINLDDVTETRELYTFGLEVLTYLGDNGCVTCRLRERDLIFRDTTFGSFEMCETDFAKTGNYTVNVNRVFVAVWNCPDCEVSGEVPSVPPEVEISPVPPPETGLLPVPPPETELLSVPSPEIELLPAPSSEIELLPAPSPETVFVSAPSETEILFVPSPEYEISDIFVEDEKLSAPSPEIEELFLHYELEAAFAPAPSNADEEEELLHAENTSVSVGTQEQEYTYNDFYG